MSLPFSSLKRRMENYVQYKTIVPSMNGPSKINIPFPLSHNLLIVYENVPCIPNSTYNGDIITSESGTETSGRRHLSQTKGYLNRQWCSLDLPTLRQHSKQWWIPFLQTKWLRDGLQFTWTTWQSIHDQKMEKHLNSTYSDTGIKYDKYWRPCKITIYFFSRRNVHLNSPKSNS